MKNIIYQLKWSDVKHNLKITKSIEFELEIEF